jgi:hypothetical protein
VSSRPDPLAEPEGYGVRPGQEEGPDLETCSTQVQGGENCQVKAGMIFWAGCTVGEHAGPLPYCDRHAIFIAGHQQMLICGQGQCEGRMVIMKVQRVLPDGRIVDAAMPADPVAQQALDQVLGDDDDATGRLGG